MKRRSLVLVGFLFSESEGRHPTVGSPLFIELHDLCRYALGFHIRNPFVVARIAVCWVLYTRIHLHGISRFCLFKVMMHDLGFF